MISFYFVLDKTYKKGTYSKVKKTLKQGKSINQYLYDMPTSIYIATTYRGKYMKQNTGIKILPKDFDNKNQKLKKSHMDYAQINLLLHDFKYRLEVNLREKLLKRRKISVDEIKEMMYYVLNGDKRTSKVVTFISAFDEFVNERKKINKHLTIVKFNAARKLFVEFEKQNGQISLDSANKEFERKFRDFCVNTKNHLNNTIAKNFKVLKTFLKFCLEKEYINNLDFMKFDTREDDLEVIHLTSDELQSLEELELKDKRLREVLDIFLFQLYTGQRKLIPLLLHLLRSGATILF